MATVQKRGNTYKITASCGYDTSGKQIRKSITFVPGKDMTPKQIEKELERQKVMLDEKCRKGTYLDGNIKFGDFTLLWEKDYAKLQLAPKTYERYKVLLKRILPEFGHMRIGRIQPQHILEFYNKLETEPYLVRQCIANKLMIDKMEKYTYAKISQLSGVYTGTIKAIKEGKPTKEETVISVCNALKLGKNAYTVAETEKKLSDQTILHHHRLLSSMFNIAVQWQIIDGNPCERVKAPKVAHKEISFLDDNQARELITLLDNAPIMFRTMIITIIYTGMRLGELCGLEWKDIDFDNDIITIQRTSQYTTGKGIFTKEPKNKSSIRTNKYPSVLFALLKEYKKWQNEERLKLGDRWHNADRLFTQYDGQPIYPGTLNKWLKEFIKDTDLPSITVHSLRHTNATLLISGGVDIRTVSRRLGHSQTSTTLNIYTHAIQSADAMAAETIGDILNKRA